VAGFVVASGSALPQGTAWSFDDLPAGRSPAGFVFVSSPPEQTGDWSILRDGANSVLAHVPQGQPSRQIAVAGGTSLANLAVSARLRFAEGEGAAGLVWRYRDAGNHYLVVLDLRAQDVRIYRVVRGNRTRLEQEDDLELHHGAWHTLKVEHRGTRMRVWINGVPVADARDRSHEEPGAIGLWTTGESAAWFDDLRAEPVVDPERRRRRE
jgi:hypothetical protein